MQFYAPSASLIHLLFAATVDGHWHLGIGDPTPMGWITTAAYVLAGLLSLRAALQTRHAPDSRRGRPEAAFWWGCGLLMLLLSVNKQLDLQTLFTDIARNLAKAGGWYEVRHMVQIWFIGALAAGGLLGLAATAWFMRGARFSCYLALVGLIFTGCFVVIRAASFHHVDTFLGYEIAGVRMNWVFELGGILVVAAAALAFRARGAEKTSTSTSKAPAAIGGTRQPAPRTAAPSKDAVRKTTPSARTSPSAAAPGAKVASQTIMGPKPGETPGADIDDDDDDPDGDDLPEIIVLS